MPGLQNGVAGVFEKTGRVLDVTLRSKKNLGHVQRENGGVKPTIPSAVKDAARAGAPSEQRHRCGMHLFTYTFFSPL